jgi:hypothetical protein
MIAEAVKFTTTNACTGFRTKTPQEVHRITLIKSYARKVAWNVGNF